MEQFNLVFFLSTTAATTQTLSQNKDYRNKKPEQTATYHKITLKKEINQPLGTSASPIVDKILECPRTKLSKCNTLILDGTETVWLLKDFAQLSKRKNVPIPDIYFTLLDAASNVVNSHAKGKERGAWIPFKM